jgi:hypothetical protein
MMDKITLNSDCIVEVYSVVLHVNEERKKPSQSSSFVLTKKESIQK